MRPALIVGGGISGLAAAYYLHLHGIPSVVVERRPRLGGVIRTDVFGGCVLEAGPDSWLTEKRAMLGLVDELGLASEVIGSNDDRRRTYVVVGGRLVPLPPSMRLIAPANPSELLSTPLFDPAAKLRMALEWFRRPTVLPDRSVADFVRDHFGQDAVERLAQPLLAGVYGSPPEDLSTDLILPRLVAYERRYGSVLKGLFKNRGQSSAAPLFQTLKGGMGALVRALRRALEPASRFVRDEAVGLRRSKEGWTLMLAGGRLESDTVILAVPACDAALILESADPELAQLVGRVGYTSSVVAGLVYRERSFTHPLDGFGMLVPRAERASVAACTWVNTKFDGRAGPDRVLLRAYLAGPPDAPALGEPQGRLLARVHGELRQWMGLVGGPSRGRVYRWHRTMPCYAVGHRALVERIASAASRHEGLYLAGNAYDGLGIPDCVRRSRRIASVAARRAATLSPSSAGQQ
ncbi:MAG: protoporphyrinogen oxidase [Bryobacterales bacterium]|nr:protoporphyrinogen oxidase [Bryobacterales bacterium]